jgi:hypothetical protein
MSETTFTCAIAQLDRETTDGYVFTSHYTVSAWVLQNVTSAQTSGTYRAGAYGSIGLELPEGEMIPFADLTAELVIG